MSTEVELIEWKRELQAQLGAAAREFDFDTKVKVAFLMDFILRDEVREVAWVADDRTGKKYGLAYGIGIGFGKLPLHSLEEARKKLLTTFVETMREVNAVRVRKESENGVRVSRET